jgi:hypothetical protein
LIINFRLSYRIGLLAIAFFASCFAHAQDGDEESAPTVEISVTKPKIKKSYIKGLKGTDSLSVSRVWAASLLVPGYSQAYNRQYWKIPVIYGSAVGLIYGGARSHTLFKETGNSGYLAQTRLFYAGAAMIYLGSLIDGVASYKTPRRIVPAKATIFSTMLPGLGQAYNGDYWKIPVIYGGFAFMAYWYDLNQMQYQRFRREYNNKMSGLPSEFPNLSESSLKNYRDNYRRERDYAVLYLALWYGVSVIDALVFAHLDNFDVSENLAMQIAPTVLIDPTKYAELGPAIGLKLSVKF